MIVDDWFMQMFQGNQVAWLAFALLIVVVGLATMLTVLWWKSPQPAKRMLLNNLFGGGKPNVANAYDDQTVRFENPTIYREGIMHNLKNKAWYFIMNLTKDSEKDLGNNANRELITKAFRVEGAPGAFYMAYSNKGTVVNPELLAIIEQEKDAHSDLKDGEEVKKPNPGLVTIDRHVWIRALEKMKDEKVIVDPVYVTTLLDPRKIKVFLPKAFTKDRLLSHENKVKEIMRNLYEGAGNKIVIVLVVITLIVSVIGLVLQIKPF